MTRYAQNTVRTIKFEAWVNEARLPLRAKWACCKSGKNF